MKINLLDLKVIVDTLAGSLSLHDRQDGFPFSNRKEAREATLMKLLRLMGQAEVTIDTEEGK